MTNSLTKRFAFLTCAMAMTGCGTSPQRTLSNFTQQATHVAVQTKQAAAHQAREIKRNTNLGLVDVRELNITRTGNDTYKFVITPNWLAKQSDTNQVMIDAWLDYHQTGTDQNKPIVVQRAPGVTVSRSNNPTKQSKSRRVLNMRFNPDGHVFVETNSTTVENDCPPIIGEAISTLLRNHADPMVPAP